MPDTRRPRRVLLLETVNEDGHRHHRAEFYPFLLGLARARGADARWWAVRVPPETMHVGGRFVVDLPDHLRALLGRELEAWAPDTVIFHDRPADSLTEMIGEVVPGVGVGDLTAVPCAEGGFDPGVTPASPGAAPTDLLGVGATVGQTLALLGLSAGELGPDALDELLLDAALPSFRRRSLVPAQQHAPEPPLRLALEYHCPYRKRVSANPAYEGLGSEVVKAHRGCSFCPKQRERQTCKTPAIERVLRQVEAHQRDSGPRVGHFAYTLDDSPFGARLGGFFEALLQRELAPSVFHMMLRADVLLGQREHLEKVLPRLEQAGHGLTVRSMGVESFADAENLRFNKGLTAEKVWACYEMIRGFERRYPRTFGVEDRGYFATILFTPWTAPEDLATNFSAARRLGDQFLEKALGTRLQLWEGLAITELARGDGLVIEEPGVPAELVAVCLSSPDFKEIWWRFEDARTERLFRLLIRLDPAPFTAAFGDDDDLLAEVRSARAGLPGWLVEDRVAIAAALVEAVLALPPEASAAEIFAHAAGVAEPTTPEPAPGADEHGPPEPPEDRRFEDEHAWTLFLLRKLSELSPDSLRGYELAAHSLGLLGEAAAVYVSFARGDELLRLCISDHDPAAAGDQPAAWILSRRFLAIVRDELPPGDPAPELLTRRLLAVFDRYAPPGGLRVAGEEGVAVF